MGITAQAVSKWETGQATVKIPVLTSRTEYDRSIVALSSSSVWYDSGKRQGERVCLIN
ncbi:hypothetical protein PV433_14570 [Paenibacillus sp. GYB004]|uniref:hypothetical protein n=1 Tax=Paenibacillus sp. GYB004 TaxID=2994393 RepID=UPI002F965A3E